MTEPSVAERGSVEERVDQLKAHVDSERDLFAKAFGIIQVIGEDNDMPGSVRVRLARNVLTAAELVRMGDDPTGQLYGRGDELQDAQPVAGRVPPHLEDGSKTVHLDLADGSSFCGLAPTAPHMATRDRHADVTCSDCIAEAPF